MKFLYSAFGLAIEADREIHGLAPLNGHVPLQASDVSLHFQCRPDHATGLAETLSYTSPHLNQSGQPALRIWNVADGLISRLEYDDGHQFWVDRRGTEVWAVWPERTTFQETLPYLLGPVFGVLLRYRGFVCLHASAVALDGMVAAFVGDAGGGKSTTAALLVRHGWQLLADDIVALTGQGGVYYVNPAFSFLSLWPESVSLICGSPDALPKFTADWEKRRLSLESDGEEFSPQPLPLRVVYLLAGASPTQRACIETIPLQDALMGLIANTYGTRILDRGMRAKEFEFLGALLPNIAVRKLFARQDPLDTEQLCGLISSDFRSLLTKN